MATVLVLSDKKSHGMSCDQVLVESQSSDSSSYVLQTLLCDNQKFIKVHYFTSLQYNLYLINPHIIRKLNSHMLA